MRLIFWASHEMFCWVTFTFLSVCALAVRGRKASTTLRRSRISSRPGGQAPFPRYRSHHLEFQSSHFWKLLALSYWRSDPAYNCSVTMPFQMASSFSKKGYCWFCIILTWWEFWDARSVIQSFSKWMINKLDYWNVNISLFLKCKAYN